MAPKTEIQSKYVSLLERGLVGEVFEIAKQGVSPDLAYAGLASAVQKAYFTVLTREMWEYALQLEELTGVKPNSEILSIKSALNNARKMLQRLDAREALIQLKEIGIL